MCTKFRQKALYFQDERGKYDFRYVFVEVEDYPRRTIIVQDNR